MKAFSRHRGEEQPNEPMRFFFIFKKKLHNKTDKNKHGSTGVREK